MFRWPKLFFELCGCFGLGFKTVFEKRVGTSFFQSYFGGSTLKISLYASAVAGNASSNTAKDNDSIPRTPAAAGMPKANVNPSRETKQRCHHIGTTAMPHSGHFINGSADPLGLTVRSSWQLGHADHAGFCRNDTVVCLVCSIRAALLHVSFFCNRRCAARHGDPLGIK